MRGLRDWEDWSIGWNDSAESRDQATEKIVASGYKSLNKDPGRRNLAASKLVIGRV